MTEPRHFIDISAIATDDLRCILDWAHAIKRGGRSLPDCIDGARLRGATLAMIFERPSTRTRVSFDVAMRQLGGESIALNSDELQLGRGESIPDTARVLSRYVDAVMLRTGEHETIVELARHSSVPIINGLTSYSHPCQIMADVMTLEEVHGPIGEQIVAWVGDGNNVATSFIHAAVKLGFELRLATPENLAPDAELMQWASAGGGRVSAGTDAYAAVTGAHAVVTDTWVSMGDTGKDERIEMLRPYQVNDKLMAHAAPGAIFMHCLPAYRGHEVTNEVIEGDQSVVFDEAENRLHVQKAILAWCFADRG